MSKKSKHRRKAERRWRNAQGFNHLLTTQPQDEAAHEHHTRPSPYTTPIGEDEPLTNGCLPVMQGAFRGQWVRKGQSLKAGTGHSITMRVDERGGGWYRGEAWLGKRRIFQGPPTRSRNEALTYAMDAGETVRFGQEWARG